MAGDALAALAEHHLLSTRQLRELLTPHASRQWMSRQLVALGDLGLVAWVGPARGEGKLWYLTGRGARYVGERADFADRTVRPLDRRQALSQNQRHLLDANEVGLQLARWARRSTPPDQVGVRSWRNEVSHRFADSAGKGCWLRPDAVVRYDAVHADGVTFARFFLELDRHTETAQQLGEKLANYWLYRYAPRGAEEEGWWRSYGQFPYVLVVLSNARRGSLEQWRHTLVAYCRTDPVLSVETEVQIRLVTLADLSDHGPYAEVFLDPLARDSVQPVWPDGTPRFADIWTNLFGVGHQPTADAGQADRSRQYAS